MEKSLITGTNACLLGVCEEGLRVALVVASVQDGSSAVSPLRHQGRKAYVLFFFLSFPSSSCAEVKVDRRLQTAELLFRRAHRPFHFSALVAWHSWKDHPPFFCLPCLRLSGLRLFSIFSALMGFILLQMQFM